MKKGLLFLGLIGLVIISCNKHEVIPPPTPAVDLRCLFEGTIGGAFLKYTENVDGYECNPGMAKQSLSGVTDAQYRFAMSSPSETPFVRISLGSITWNDPTGNSRASLDQFNDFFQNNMNPAYSDAALNGFEASFGDINGDVWRSYADSIPQSVTFVPSSIVQESDESGDYSKFVCQFSCPIYHIYEVIDISVNPQTNPPTMRDSVAVMMIDDAIMTGYWKR